MTAQQNVMIINGEDIGISKIELDKSDLRVIDESGKYCLQVCVAFNWKDINNVKVGTKENIDFNEYILALNNESALIWPSSSYVEKITNDKVIFDLEFNDLSDNNICYMNRKKCFYMKLNSIKVKVSIDYNDAVDGLIIYK